MLDLSYGQSLKPNNDESRDSDNDSKFDSFAEELENNLYDLNVNDQAFLFIA